VINSTGGFSTSFSITSTILTILSICVSTILLLSIEKIKTATRSSFEGTLSQIDLIVGARSSPLQILLYSVFRIGDATNNIRYTTLEKIKSPFDSLNLKKE
jgi:putative ABC transport system permease protein